MKTRATSYCGFVLLIAGFLIALVSAPRYGVLLAAALVLEAGAIVCFFRGVKTPSLLGRTALIIGITLAAVTMIDGLLRLTLKTRIFDFL